MTVLGVMRQAVHPVLCLLDARLECGTAAAEWETKGTGWLALTPQLAVGCWCQTLHQGGEEASCLENHSGGLVQALGLMGGLLFQQSDLVSVESLCSQSSFSLLPISDSSSRMKCFYVCINHLEYSYL